MLDEGIGLGLVMLPAVAIAVADIGAAATHGSRWYVTPSLTTLIAMSLPHHPRSHDVEYRFDQRVVETLVGVGIAYVFGLLVPALTARRRACTRPGHRDEAAAPGPD